MKIAVISITLGAAALLCPEGALSFDIAGGMMIDSSSNILMRAAGEPGSMSTVYSDFGQSFAGNYAWYGASMGLLTNYDAVQIHKHNAGISRPVVSRERLAVDVGAACDIVRYGDVTLLRGYNQYSALGKAKRYLTSSTLLRSELAVRGRRYRLFDSQDFAEGESYVRLDRFFDAGVTLRGQLDLDVRRYARLPDDPTIMLIGFRGRIARSLGDRCGIWLELHDRGLIERSTGGAETAGTGSGDVTPSDGALGYDRIFLDDRYKFSSYGARFHGKYILGDRSDVRFEASVAKKTYKGGLMRYYTYLPPDGWDELEWSVQASVSCATGYLPRRIHPRFDVYCLKSDASDSGLSYDSLGFTIGFDIY
ncbi:MAG: hypothetical protein J7M24_03775 [Candidatus Latescibacteria bacterium]|nr:hypothetical protein [Candidatus Latescibacterota bacterium]